MEYLYKSINKWCRKKKEQDRKTKQKRDRAGNNNKKIK